MMRAFPATLSRPSLWRANVEPSGAPHASAPAMPFPQNIPVDDPATPHIRIIHKESKVIRLVQWQPAKRSKIAENRGAGPRSLKACRDLSDSLHTLSFLI